MKKRYYSLKAGSIKNLQILETEMPRTGPQEVLVEVKAFGLNFADIFAIWGLYSATPEGHFTPGLEFSGVVLDTGAEVDSLKTGDRVMGLTRFGGYSSLINSDYQYVVPLPDDWDFNEGASYLVQVLTAYYALVYLGNLESGNTVLIQSAAGGVGIWANRIAQHFNAKTIGAVGSESKFPILQDEGYDHYLVRSKAFGKDLDAVLNGRDLNLILECIGGRILSASYQRLAPQGRMIVYGSARYAHPGNRPNYLRLAINYVNRPRIDPQKMIEKNRSVMGFNLIWLYPKVKLMHSLLNEIESLNLGKPLVGHTFGFERLREALTFFKSGKSVGKIVIEVEATDQNH